MIENEQELVNGCRRRERLAQKRLYDTFGGKMFALCLRYVKNRADAEDVLQEAFIKIYESIHIRNTNVKAAERYIIIFNILL